ncbi:POK6 protein, partial [Zapornia atra]|nr:POK6 protein [Zapornia atra]
VQGQWLQEAKLSRQPLADALTVYTDAGKRSKTAAITWRSGQRWESQLLRGNPQDSLQTLELAAVVWVAAKWLTTPLNIVTDSLYVAGIVSRIEDASLKDVQNQRLGELLR